MAQSCHHISWKSAWFQRPRLYCGRGDAENRIKELKADFGLDAFNMGDFWATEAALAVAKLAYNLMNLFRQSAMKSRIQHTLSTLNGLVLATGGRWCGGPGNDRLLLSVPRRKRAWFCRAVGKCHRTTSSISINNQNC